MSTIRELIIEVRNTGKSHPLIKQLAAAGVPTSTTPQVNIIDAHEVAVVFVDEQPVGVVTVDWSEPCLEFKPLAK